MRSKLWSYIFNFVAFETFLAFIIPVCRFKIKVTNGCYQKNISWASFFVFIHASFPGYSFWQESYGCSFGAKFMFLYSEKSLIFGESFSYWEEMLLYSDNHFNFQRKFHIQWISLYLKNISLSKNILLCSVSFLLHSDKSSIFKKKKNVVFKETFYTDRKSLFSKKIFIFKENIDIQRKPQI